MPYIPPEVVARAREMDLLTYLRTYEPQELVHFGGDTYCTREHDSLKIIIILSPIDSDERKLSLAEQKLFKKVSILLSLFFLGIYFILLMLKIWNCAASVGVGIVIPALLQIPCLFRRNKKPTS